MTSTSDPRLLRRTVGACLRALPHVPGKGRLVNLARQAFPAGSSDLVTARMRDGFVLSLDLRSAMQSHAYFSGEYDTAVVHDLASLIQQEWVVIDVGASIGFYTIPLARRCTAVKAVMIAVEPLPSNFETLQRNLAINGVAQLTIAANVALGRERGSVNLVLREDFVAGAITGNASVEIADGKDAAFQTVRVPVDTLDHLLAEKNCGRVDMIRVDIEGGEKDLFAGGSQAIARSKPLIYGEFNEWFLNRRRTSWLEIRESLASSGYAFFVRHWNRWIPFAKATTERDVLCVPTERMDFVRNHLNLAHT